MSMVNLIRRKCMKTKTGHAGTLDPLATGVLVLGVGKMTKKLGQMMETNKRLMEPWRVAAHTKPMARPKLFLQNHQLLRQ